MGGCVNVPGTCVMEDDATLQVFVRKVNTSVDAGTQVIDRTWRELKRSLGNTFPVSVKVDGHRVADPTLSDLVFQFVYRQSLMPSTPNEFYTALKRLLKAS